MSDDKPAADASAQDSPQESAAAEPELQAEAAPADADTPESSQDADSGETTAAGQPAESEQAAEQLTLLQDQVLRAQAEMENVRRRAARDVENAHKFALEKFTADLLPVLDSLEKAVEAGAAGDPGADPQEAAAGAVIEGVELSLKLFVSTLEKSGVSQIDPLGEPFDPQLHEAMAMVPNPDAEPNSVLDVMQKGYSLNGRLVRAAKVIVVSAPEQTEQT